MDGSSPSVVLRSFQSTLRAKPCTWIAPGPNCGQPTRVKIKILSHDSQSFIFTTVFYEQPTASRTRPLINLNKETSTTKKRVASTHSAEDHH